MESDGAVEVLKEIRDEIRNVRTELIEQLRNARAGVRTELVDRASRFRLAATAGTGAVALLALVLALRAGGSPAKVAMPPPAVATTGLVTPSVLSAPGAPAATAAAAAKPAAAKPAATKPAKLAATAPAAPPTSAAPKRWVRPAAAVKPAAPTPAGEDDEPMAFSPPPRRVRVHKMSYGPVESEPAKL